MRADGNPPTACLAPTPSPSASINHSVHLLLSQSATVALQGEPSLIFAKPWTVTLTLMFCPAASVSVAVRLPGLRGEKAMLNEQDALGWSTMPTHVPVTWNSSSLVLVRRSAAVGDAPVF
jgi:hypothetical protein